MTVSVLDKHIEIDPAVVGGKPHIKGHRIMVQNIVIWHEHMGKSADEITSDHNLSLSEIYAALSYYFDNQDEINTDIRTSEAFVEEMKKQNVSVLKEKLSKLSD